VGHWLGEGLTPDEFADLVSPLVNRDTALEITWGGAAACGACKVQTEEYERETGMEIDCYQTRETGGECRYPAPEVLPRLRALWSVFRDSSDAIKRAGMDGEPDGRNLAEVRIVAEAHGEPFDATFLARWGVLMSAQRLIVSKKRKQRAK
jgi:hypothetical protein